MADEEHGHARRDVVPGDDGDVHVRRVVADENGHGIGLGETAGPRPRGHGTDAADDKKDAGERVKHRAPRAGRSAVVRVGL